LSDQELFQRVARWRDHNNLESLSAAAMAEVTRAQGLDFATALLYQRVLQSQRFGAAIESVRRSPNHWASLRLSPLLAVVPGAFHGEHMDTGADGRRSLKIAQARGFRGEVIPTHSFGSMCQNAQIVGDWLSTRVREEMVLVCLSKAAAEVAHLLREGVTSLLRNVAAVVNLSPMMFGSKLVDRVVDHPLRRLFVRGFLWWKNYDFANLVELRYKSALLPPCGSPVAIINVSGFPLERDLSSPMARRQYRRMRPFGPNDGGGVLLADTIRLPGTLFPVWGADHYLRRPDNFPELLGQILCSAAASKQPPEYGLERQRIKVPSISTSEHNR
jgi:hypothetical protein